MKYHQWLEIWLNNYVKTTCKARTCNIYTQAAARNYLRVAKLSQNGAPVRSRCHIRGKQNLSPKVGGEKGRVFFLVGAKAN